MRAEERDGRKPLAGVRVVELGDSAAAPYAGFILACLGAEVFKIERPQVGDASRSWGASRWKGSGPVYHALNRGKKSVTMDIKDPADLARLKALIATADVFLHNLRPGTPVRFGLDEASVTALKPSLVYCAVGAFGARGPMNHLPGFDPLLQAYSGIMSLTGEPGQAPVRAGVSIVDFGTGMWAAMGVLTALFARASSGAGAVVHSSLYETALGWMSASIADYQVSKVVPERMGSGISFIAPYRAYPTSDGYLVVACANDRLFAKLCRVFGRAEWIEDPRFKSNADRVRHRDELDAAITAITRTRSRAELRALLEEAGIPCSPIQTVDEVIADPQTVALDILRAVPDDDMKLVAMPISFDGERPAPAHGGHALGQDGGAVDDALRSVKPRE